jgi:hypothetical protein
MLSAGLSGRDADGRTESDACAEIAGDALVPSALAEFSSSLSVGTVDWGAHAARVTMTMREAAHRDAVISAP